MIESLQNEEFVEEKLNARLVYESLLIKFGDQNISLMRYIANYCKEIPLCSDFLITTLRKKCASNTTPYWRKPCMHNETVISKRIRC